MAPLPLLPCAEWLNTTEATQHSRNELVPRGRAGGLTMASAACADVSECAAIVAVQKCLREDRSASLLPTKLWIAGISTTFFESRASLSAAFSAGRQAMKQRSFDLLAVGAVFLGDSRNHMRRAEPDCFAVTFC